MPYAHTREQAHELIDRNGLQPGLGLEPAAPGGRQQAQQQRLRKRFRMEALPTKDLRAVIRLINSLAGTDHAQAEAS